MEQDQLRTTANSPALTSSVAQQIVHDDEEEGISLGEIIGTVMEYKWLVAVITLVALIVGRT